MAESELFARSSRGLRGCSPRRRPNCRGIRWQNRRKRPPCLGYRQTSRLAILRRYDTARVELASLARRIDARSRRKGEQQIEQDKKSTEPSDSPETRATRLLILDEKIQHPLTSEPAADSTLPTPPPNLSEVSHQRLFGLYLLEEPGQHPIGIGVSWCPGIVSYQLVYSVYSATPPSSSRASII